jgi:hypothetical protein
LFQHRDILALFYSGLATVLFYRSSAWSAANAVRQGIIMPQYATMPSNRSKSFAFQLLPEKIMFQITRRDISRSFPLTSVAYIIDLISRFHLLIIHPFTSHTRPRSKEIMLKSIKTFAQYSLLVAALLSASAFATSQNLAQRIPQIVYRGTHLSGGWSLSLASADDVCPANSSACGASYCCPSALSCVIAESENRAEACCPRGAFTSAILLLLTHSKPP